jgi:acetylornithine deacetylase/succinyl-diaminopimelate desuccinylase-like protein
VYLLIHYPTLNYYQVKIMKQIKELRKYIDENIEEHISRLAELVRQPSIGVSGEGTRECAEIIRHRMRELGFHTAELYNIDANPIVFGEIKSEGPETDKTLLLYGAYDSNPVEEDNWSYPPFEGKIVEKENLGTCMVSRGVNNKMKIVGILNAIETVRHVFREFPLNLLVVFDGEEEVFSPTLARFVQDKEDWLQKADALYMPFSSQNSQGISRVQLGYKGVLYLELESTGKTWKRGPSEHEIHSMHRPVVDNPVWHLISALCSMTRNNGNDIVMDGFHEDIKEPTKEFQGMMNQLAEHFDVEGYMKGLKVQNLISDTGETLEILKLLFTTSQINIDGIWGGYTDVGVEAIIPPAAKVKIDVRLIPNQKSEKIYSCIKDHLQKHGFSDIVVHKLAAVESCQTSISEDISQALIRSYQDNGFDFQVWPSSLATIPIHRFNDPPLNLPFATGCVGLGGNSHGPNEYAVIKGKGKIAGFAEYEMCIASLIYEYSK